jgi:hypothetical protein
MIRRFVLSLLGAMLMAASPAAADWLITRAGGRVETKGPWQVRGKLVVFTPAAGPLSSLRLSEVDLEASRKATADAKAQTAAVPAPVTPKKKLAVLTDKDFRKPEGSAPVKPAAAAVEHPSAPAGPLAVSSWKRTDRTGGDGIEIQGTLHNTTDDLMIEATVEVQLYNEAGDRIGTAPGVLSSPSLQPASTVDFRASFPGVFAFSEVKFETKGLSLDAGSTPVDRKPPEQAPP